jgi:hypothetical protein
MKVKLIIIESKNFPDVSPSFFSIERERKRKTREREREKEEREETERTFNFQEIKVAPNFKFFLMHSFKVIYVNKKKNLNHL